jgi:hypothetical protein
MSETACIGCSKPLLLGARFCRSCGLRVGDQPTPAELSEAIPGPQLVAAVEVVSAAPIAVSSARTTFEPNDPEPTVSWAPPTLPASKPAADSDQLSKPKTKNNSRLLIGVGMLVALAIGGVAVVATSGKSSKQADSKTVTVDTTTNSDESAVQDTEASIDTNPIIASPDSATAAVPDVLGASESSANDALVAVGLSARMDRDYSATTASGFVVRQNPTAGSVANRGSVVDVVVSQGPPPGIPSPEPQAQTDIVEVAANEGRTVDANGRTAEDAFRSYYERYNSGDYAGAFGMESGDFATKITEEDLANWPSKVSRAVVQSVECDGRPEDSLCDAHMNFELAQGGYSDERTQVGMRIVSGQWTFNTYRVIKAVKR